MIGNGKIHLTCPKCFKGIDYLVSRYIGYLRPKCACGQRYSIDQSDLVNDTGMCYKAQIEEHSQ